MSYLQVHVFLIPIDMVMGYVMYIHTIYINIICTNGNYINIDVLIVLGALRSIHVFRAYQVCNSNEPIANVCTEHVWDVDTANAWTVLVHMC